MEALNVALAALRARLTGRCGAVYGHLVCTEKPHDAGYHVARVGRNRWKAIW